jgi:CheY-like chemotaxis protein
MKRILVVDDNKAITDLVKIMVQSFGYGCMTANTAQECLDLIRADRFDLILLDLAMPKVTGIDLLEQMKEESSLDHNRIIIFTASAFTESRFKDLRERYGVLYCMRKPIAKAKLLEVVSKYLNCDCKWNHFPPEHLV